MIKETGIKPVNATAAIDIELMPCNLRCTIFTFNP